MSNMRGQKPVQTKPPAILKAGTRVNVVNHSDIVILADADNTLWDTDAVFAEAQIKLLSVVEQLTGLSCRNSQRLRYVRSYDQALASRHHLHLRYPPQMLVTA